MKDRIHSIGNKREKYPRVSAWRAFTSPRGRPGCGQAWDVCITGPAVYARWRVRGLQTADVAGVCVSRVSVCCAQRYRCCAAVRCAMCCFPDSSPWSFQAHISRGTRKPTAAYICIYTQQPTSSYSLFLYMLTQKVWMKHTPACRVLISLSIEIKTEQTDRSLS